MELTADGHPAYHKMDFIMHLAAQRQAISTVIAAVQAAHKKESISSKENMASLQQELAEAHS